MPEHISPETRLAVREDASFQPIGDEGEAVILSFESGQLFTCNKTTRALLEAVSRKGVWADVLDALAARYDAPREKIASDMAAMARRLIDGGILTIADEPDA